MASIGVHEPVQDLWMPRPAEEERWDPHTIHTHYFGFSIPEQEIGAFIYLAPAPHWASTVGSASGAASTTS